MQMEPKEKSGLEIRYMKLLEDNKDPNQIQMELEKISHPHREEKNLKQILTEITPNEQFINSFNKRFLKEEEEAKRKYSRQLVNEHGKTYARYWEKEGFSAIHDPLGNFY